MADRQISELTEATTVTDEDLFVLQQSNRAKKLTGRVFRIWALREMQDHGGIDNIAKTSTSVLDDTYTITFADETTTTFVVSNGMGITNIAKTGTSGLVDTYTISYNNGTTSTYTVTNGQNQYIWIRYSAEEPTQDSDMHLTMDDWIGLYYGTSSTAPTHYDDYTWFNIKGEKGDNVYTWIKYSTNQPTQNSDMHDEPDNWMGIYNGRSSSAPTLYIEYEWFQIKGEKGEKGDDITIVSASTRYSTSTSSTSPPATWSDNIPTVNQGDFLWTKTNIVYSDGNSTTTYSVARQGRDGSGAVSTVNGIMPDNGDVHLYDVQGTTLVFA